jgi:hypothetical protein
MTVARAILPSSLPLLGEDVIPEASTRELQSMRGSQILSFAAYLLSNGLPGLGHVDGISTL